MRRANPACVLLAATFALCIVTVACKPRLKPSAAAPTPEPSPAPAAPEVVAEQDAQVSSGETPAAVAKPLADGERFVVLIEPTFMRPPVSRPFASSKETVLALCVRSAQGDIRHATRDEAPAVETEWDTLLAATKEELRPLLEAAQPAMYRGRGDVVQYAWIDSENPLTATMLLAPNLVAKFKDLFGDKLRVVIPARDTIYVLPALGVDVDGYGLKFQRIYESALHPVSLEVFEVTRDAIRAAGTFKN